MAKVLVRQYGADDFSMGVPDNLVGQKYLNCAITPPVDLSISDIDPAMEIPRTRVELKFVGYEELGGEMLPIYEVIK